MNLTFAIINYNDFNAKKYARKVSGKTWLKQYANKLNKYQDNLNTANCDKDFILKSMLHNAFGVNIGEQIFVSMSIEQKRKTIDFIKWEL